jgi:hypothetical protein
MASRRPILAQSSDPKQGKPDAVKVIFCFCLANLPLEKEW